MAEKILSVFIDESGDFGPYDFHAPFYLVAMVLHNQDVDISKNIDDLENHLTNIGYKQHAIHTGPLIRRESVYANDLMEERKRLFNALFNFVLVNNCVGFSLSPFYGTQKVIAYDYPMKCEVIIT